MARGPGEHGTDFAEGRGLLTRPAGRPGPYSPNESTPRPRPCRGLYGSEDLPHAHLFRQLQQPNGVLGTISARCGSPMIAAQVRDLREIEAFSFVWPTETERFEVGWTYQLKVLGQTHIVRHGLGSRLVYGKRRVHTVTWLDGNVEVEGVEADDYPATQALVSLLRHPDKTLVRTLPEVPAGYEGFEIVDHRREIDAKFSRHSLAVKIREDDLLSWAIHAWLRHQSRHRVPAARRVPHVAPLPARAIARKAGSL